MREKRYVTFKFHGASGPSEVTVLRSSIVGMASYAQFVATDLLLDSGARQHINYLDYNDAKKTLDDFDKDHAVMAGGVKE